MRILAFGSYRLWEQPRVRILFDGLRESGHEVVECNVPLPLDTASRARAASQPWRAPVLAFRLTQLWPRLWRKARRMLQPDVVLVPYLGHFDIHLARRLWPKKPVILDLYLFLADTALDRGTSSRVTLGLLDRIDRAAVRTADLVVVDTEGHRSLLPEPARSRSLIVPVGAGREWFHEPAARPDGPLRVIFFGIFTPLQGTAHIGAAMRIVEEAAPEVKFTMVGRGPDHEKARDAAGSKASAEWLDWIDYSELPEFVAGHDVCLGIFGAGPKALRVVPNKVYQGAAAGCAILTSDTRPQRAALDDAAVFAAPGDPRALAQALIELAQDRAKVWRLRQAAFRRAVDEFGPARVVAPLDEWLRARSASRATAARR